MEIRITSSYEFLAGNIINAKDNVFFRGTFFVIIQMWPFFKDNSDHPHISDLKVTSHLQLCMYRLSKSFQESKLPVVAKLV